MTTSLYIFFCLVTVNGDQEYLPCIIHIKDEELKICTKIVYNI